MIMALNHIFYLLTYLTYLSSRQPGKWVDTKLQNKQNITVIVTTQDHASCNSTSLLL